MENPGSRGGHVVSLRESPSYLPPLFHLLSFSLHYSLIRFDVFVKTKYNISSDFCLRFIFNVFIKQSFHKCLYSPNITSSYPTMFLTCSSAQHPQHYATPLWPQRGSQP